MRRRKRLSGIKWPDFLEAAKDAVSRNIAFVAAVLLSLTVAVLLIGAFLHRSDYFRLKSVDTKGVDDAAITSYIKNELGKYKNVNIFDINVKAAARSLMAKYPDAKDIVIIRSLPDKLTVLINFRKAVALVGDLARFYPVDSDGYIFSGGAERSTAGLPVITGTGGIWELKPGRKNESKNLKAALALLKEIKKMKFPAFHRLSRIEARDINRLSFYLDDDIEIKIGYENLKSRLNALRNTLRDPRLVKGRVRYIDLRFEDIVIGPK